MHGEKVADDILSPGRRRRSPLNGQHRRAMLNYQALPDIVAIDIVHCTPSEDFTPEVGSAEAQVEPPVMLDP